MDFRLLDILNVITLIGVTVLTFFFWKERSYLRELFPQSGSRDIRTKFKELIEVVNLLTNKEEELVKDFAKLRHDNLSNLQRVSLVRYNPYGDTGGDQSFSICFLDGEFNGFLITSLHSRSGTRVYAKPIIKGKSDIELSKEETSVLQKALNS